MSYYWNYKNIFNTVGQVLFYSSFTFILPLLFSIIFREGRHVYLVYLLILFFGILFGYVLQKSIIKEPSFSDYSLFSITLTQALMVVVFVWLLYAFFAALPFYFLSPQHSFLDSFFDSMSALTTTGFSMYAGLITPLKSLTLWRSFISWLGGLGIIMLAFFGLMKGVYGSSKLFSAEGHERMRPNIKKTIQNMWIIYIVITVIGIILLNVFGMSLFDSINYSMSAVSITGVQSNAQSLESIGNLPIYITLILLLFLGSTSFFLHYSFFLKKSFKVYFKDSQFLYMILLFFSAALLIFLKLKGSTSFVMVLLTVAGLYAPGNIMVFTSPFVFIIFLIVMFIGGSSGSTASGIKVDRFIIFIKSIVWKVRQINLPDIAYFPKKFNGEIIDNSKIKNAYFLILVYAAFIIFGILMFSFYGYPIQESAFDVISAQGNIGFTTGIVSSTLPSPLKIMLIINMWVGRLEIIPVLSVLGILFFRKYLI